MSAGSRSRLKNLFEDHFAADSRNRDRIASPGSQYVVQLLRGGYLGDDWVAGRGRSALDIGCGAGFDLVSLDRMGWKACGCDVTEEIVARARANVAKFSATAEISVGTHGALPYDDRKMALILALNSVHYCAKESDMPVAIAEIKRVLAPGGLLMVALVHPESWILSGAEQVSAALLRISRPDDFRHDQTMYVFPTVSDVKTMFADFFAEVDVAINRISYFRKTLVNYIVIASAAR